MNWIFTPSHMPKSGPGSSARIVTDYGLDDPGIESRWGWDFPPIQTSPGAHPGSCTMGTGSFLGVKSGRGVLLTTHPPLAPRLWKSRAIPLPPLGHNQACNGVTLPLSLHMLNTTYHISYTSSDICKSKTLFRCVKKYRYSTAVHLTDCMYQIFPFGK
jgi:hypothetical protein